MTPTEELQILEEEERKVRPDIVRAQRAEQILNDVLFKEAVQAIKDRLFKEFSASEVLDTERMRIMNISNRVLDSLVGQIDEHIRSGKIAAKRIADIQEKKSFLKRFKKAS